MGNESVTIDNKALQRFDKALDSMRSSVELQAKLLEQVQKCMKTLVAMTGELVKRSNGALEFEAKDGVLSISANGRTLTFIPTSSMALDSHLHRARCQSSGMILIFGHTEEEKGSSLIRSYRVYADGICGTSAGAWRLDNSDGIFFSQLVDLIADTLLEPEICWPHNEDFSDEIKNLPIASGKTDAGKLPSKCIGFQCAMPRSSSQSK